jgi:hypothetical protein
MESRKLILGVLTVVALLIVAPYLRPEGFYFKDDASFAEFSASVQLPKSLLEVGLIGVAGYLVYTKLK